MSCQCEGKTKAGVRCTKRTLHESKRCHFHRDAPAAVESVAAPVAAAPAAPVTIRVALAAPVALAPVALAPVAVAEPEVVSKRGKNTKAATKATKPVLSERCSDKTECCVCMEEMPGSDKLDCGHPLCRDCVGNLRNDKCPLCRREIKAKHITAKQKADMRHKFIEDRISRNSAATHAFIQQDQQQSYSNSAAASAVATAAATHQAFIATILNLLPINPYT